GYQTTDILSNRSPHHCLPWQNYGTQRCFSTLEGACLAWIRGVDRHHLGSLYNCLCRNNLVLCYFQNPKTRKVGKSPGKDILKYVVNKSPSRFSSGCKTLGFSYKRSRNHPSPDRVLRKSEACQHHFVRIHHLLRYSPQVLPPRRCSSS